MFCHNHGEGRLRPTSCARRRGVLAPFREGGGGVISRLSIRVVRRRAPSSTPKTPKAPRTFEIERRRCARPPGPVRHADPPGRDFKTYSGARAPRNGPRKIRGARARFGRRARTAPPPSRGRGRDPPPVQAVKRRCRGHSYEISLGRRRRIRSLGGDRRRNKKCCRTNTSGTSRTEWRCWRRSWRRRRRIMFPTHR